MFVRFVLILCCLQLARTQNTNDAERLQDVAAESAPSSSSGGGSGDDAKDLLGDNLTWACANNASCVQSIADELVGRLKQHRPMSIGGIEVNPLADLDAASQQGRGGLSFVDLLSQNSVKIPLGPMVVSVQKSVDHKDYLEVALLRKGDDNGEFARCTDIVEIAVRTSSYNCN